MLAILNFLNAHNSPIFQPILMILISKFMVYRAFSDKTYLLLMLLSTTLYICTVEMLSEYILEQYVSIMHQSFVSPAPSGSGNSGTLSFSIIKALGKALLGGDKGALTWYGKLTWESA